jgi:hypothetical protein
MGFVGPFFSWNVPWRSPDLRRFARTAQFRELQSAAGTWIELLREPRDDHTPAPPAWTAHAEAVVRPGHACALPGRSHVCQPE